MQLAMIAVSQMLSVRRMGSVNVSMGTLAMEDTSVMSSTSVL